MRTSTSPTVADAVSIATGTARTSRASWQPPGGARQYEETGVAPGAHLINLKVLDEHGEGTAGDVIEAIDWAVEHRRRYRIRVLNLSLGGTPMQSWRDRPAVPGRATRVRGGHRGRGVGGQSGEDRGRYACHRRRDGAGDLPARDYGGGR